MSPESRSALINLASRAYAGSLIGLPREFRARFGTEMVQIFRDRCHDAAVERGGLGLMAVCLHAGFDLARSIVRERIASIQPASALALALGILFGVIAAYLDFHTDDVQVAAFSLLVGTFFIALWRPAGAWRWAMASGLCIFAAYEICPWFGVRPKYPAEPGNYATLIALIPALIGAYSGVLLRRVTRLRSS